MQFPTEGKARGAASADDYSIGRRLDHGDSLALCSRPSTGPLLRRPVGKQDYGQGVQPAEKENGASPGEDSRRVRLAALFGCFGMEEDGMGPRGGLGHFNNVGVKVTKTFQESSPRHFGSPSGAIRRWRLRANFPALRLFAGALPEAKSRARATHRLGSEQGGRRGGDCSASSQAKWLPANNPNVGVR